MPRVLHTVHRNGEVTRDNSFHTEARASWLEELFANSHVNRVVLHMNSVRHEYERTTEEIEATEPNVEHDL